jgi:hypothetical protein
MARKLKGISARELSRRATAAGYGIDHSAISRLAGKGDIPRLSDKSFAPDVCLPILAQRYAERVAGGAGDAAAAPSASPAVPSRPASDHDLSVRQRKELAATRKMEAEAAIKQLDHRKREGELVEVDDVRADAAAFAAEMRSALQVLGARVAPLVVGLSVAEAQAVIDDGVNEALTAIHSSDYADDEPAVAAGQPCPVCGRGPSA